MKFNSLLSLEKRSNFVPHSKLQRKEFFLRNKITQINQTEKNFIRYIFESVSQY